MEKGEDLALDDGDRLSDLHDSLAAQILFFLSPRESVQTSVLSKRWRHVWTAVPDLEISVRHGDGADIEPLLDRRRHGGGGGGGGLGIRQFVFKSGDPGCRWCVDCNDRLRKAVLFAAAQPRLRILRIEIRCKWDRLQLDSDVTDWILGCQSLESLELLGVSLPDTRHHQQRPLPNLRFLHIGDGGDWVGDLISRCPVLERLKLWRLDGRGNSGWTHDMFNSQSLEFLELNSVSLNKHDLLNPLCLGKLRALHLQYVRIVNHGIGMGEINLSCPVLEDLFCLVTHGLGFHHISAPQLRRLKISGYDSAPHPPAAKLDADEMKKIRDCPSLESLEVQKLCYVELPTSIGLSKLRVLHVEQVSGVSWDLMGGKVLRLPALESLRLLDVRLRVLNICAPKLKELLLQTPILSALSLSCASLELFELKRPGILKHFQVDMPKLVKASMSLYKNETQKNWGIDQIIASCPALEELSLCAGHLSIINFSAPCLKTLHLSSVRADVIRISCPRLEHFRLQAPKTLRYFQADMPSLIEAFISVDDHKSLDHFNVHYIVKSLKNATTIHLWPSDIELCPHHLLRKPKRLPTFPNLKTLVLHACFYNENIEALIYLLEHSPQLEVLHIKHKVDCRCLNKKASWKTRKLSCEILEHLKEVIIPERIHNKREFVKFLSMNVVEWDKVKKRGKSWFK